jgi:hypothetical protein
MNKINLVILVLIAILTLVATFFFLTRQKQKDFVVYDDQDVNYIPSGWMGDFRSIEYDPKFSKNPKSGIYCQKWIYKGGGSNLWVGVVWQHPQNNWGDVDGGLNLGKFTKIKFWARGEKGGEQIDKFKVGAITGGKYSDSDSAFIGPIILSKEWKEYTIDLKGKNMSYIIGGFSWTANEEANPGGCTFYLDDIRYE